LPEVEKRVAELKLGPQVKFLGFVPDEELRCLYRLSQFLVLPTLFEASSLPMFEAWFEGVPVASSNATALPDQALDAALFFDPLDVSAIADAISRMATDANLRRELIERGHRRLQDFDRERTAKAYRAVYRRAAGFPLTDEDRLLLSWDWMRNPEKNGSLRSDDRKRA
jgi:glycosyltransferase involved in cell wall biosynthesis